jgi:RNA polymerase sigma-54 factor
VIPTLTLEAKPQFELRASPELIAYAGLLALPAAELEQTVEHELVLNPALERDDRPVCPFCGELLARASCTVCARTPRRSGSEGTADAALAARLSPEEVLLAELRPLAHRSDLAVLEHIIGSLDERGYLDASQDQIAARLEVSRAQVDRVVALVRRNGPPGIAAVDLRECLLLQLASLDEDDDVALAREIVSNHLERLASGRWDSVAAALGVSWTAVASAAELVRMRVRPFVALDPPDAVPAPPALPDVIVRECAETGALLVELVEPRRIRVTVAQSYATVTVSRLDGEERARVEEQLAHARAFLHRLDRRWQTMRAVAEVVVERQRAFVLRGPRFIEPLTRATIAAELGVHESTVSRATNGRFVLLPSGRLVAFSSFFESAQGACAALAQLVADERSPTSDAKLAAELTELGFPVARRTVAKYRERLGIPAHARRRREAIFAAAAR